MNTKNNRRHRDTTESLVRSFYKIYLKKGSIEKVTVREICEDSQVNRSTFYAHFPDVYALREAVERTMAQQLTEAFLSRLEDRKIGECFVSLFEFIREYREFYQIYLSETAHAGIIGLAREFYADRIETIPWQELGMSSREELAYHEDFYIAGISAMIRRWVNTDCRESPREMVEILGRQYRFYQLTKEL